MKSRVLGTFRTGTKNVFLGAWGIEEGCFVINTCLMLFLLQISISISIG